LLICANDFDPRFTKAKNKTCSIAIGSQEVKMARIFTRKYTERFLNEIQANLTKNFHDLGTPLLIGMEAENKIPSSKEGTHAGVNSHVMNEFSESCISDFNVIMKETIRSELNQFVKDSKNSTEAEINTLKERFKQNYATKSNERMETHIETCWATFKKKTNDDFELLTNQLQESTDSPVPGILGTNVTGHDIPKSALEKRKGKVGIDPSKRKGRYKKCTSSSCNRVVKWLGSLSRIIQSIAHCVIRLVQGVIGIVKDGFSIVMTVMEGINEFSKALIAGDINTAFQELGRGFTKAYHQSVKLAQHVAGIVWKGMLGIKDLAIKFGKFLCSIRPAAWAALIIAIVIGGIFSFGLVALAGSLSLPGLWLAGEVAFLVVSYKYIDVAIERKLQSVIDPGSMLLADGTIVRKDPQQNNRYCLKPNVGSLQPAAEGQEPELEEGALTCLNDHNDFCLVDSDPEVCTDQKDITYAILDGIRSTYNPEKATFVPILKKMGGMDYNVTRGEYCRIQDSELYCLNNLDLVCLIEESQDKSQWCMDDVDEWWRYDENGTKISQKNDALQAKKGGETCKDISGELWCINANLKAFCTMSVAVEYEWCEDLMEGKKGEYFAWQDLQRHYYNFENDTFTPRLNVLYRDGFYWEIDVERNEYCTFDINMNKICHNQDKDIYCQIIEDGEIGSCSK